MLKYTDFRRLQESKPADAPASEEPQELKRFDVVINKAIDDFLNKLKQQLINTYTQPQNQRGLWDRFKNFWSNTWHGRYNQQNPYFWQNKLGDDLGQNSHEHTIQLTLEEYKAFYPIFEEAEKALAEDTNSIAPGAERLRIIRIIDRLGKDLKNQVGTIVAKAVDVPGADQESIPNPTAPSKPEPSAVDPAKEAPPTASPVPAAAKEPPAAAPEAVPTKAADGTHVAANDPNLSKPVAPRDPNGPPSEGKTWDQLTHFEKSEWNRYGGGTAERKQNRWTGLKKNGIESFPWILRLGDPRLEKMAELQHDLSYQHLDREGRIEKSSDPIKSPEELAQRVAKAKQLKAELHSRNNRSEEERIAADQAQAGQPTSSAPVQPAQAEAPADKPVAAPVQHDAPDSNVSAPMGNKPEEKPPEEIPARQERLKGEVEALTQFMKPDGSILLDDNGSEYRKLMKMVNSSEALTLKMLEKKIAQIKAKGEKDGYVDYSSHFKNAANAVAADQAQADADDDRSEFPESVTQLQINRYKRLLRNQTNETYKPVINHRKVESLSIQERIQYFKQLMKK